MKKQLVKMNESGRRIGESHPRAVLSDHDVELLMKLLDERDALIRRLRTEGARQADIDRHLTATGLSYRHLAEKFEVHREYIGKIARGVRRCQTAG